VQLLQYDATPANADLQAFPFWRYGWYSVMVLSSLVTLAFDLSNSKWGYGSPVSWASFLTIFSLLRPSILNLGSGAGQIDNGHHCTMFSPYRGGSIKSCVWLHTVRYTQHCQNVYCLHILENHWLPPVSPDLKTLDHRVWVAIFRAFWNPYWKPRTGSKLQVALEKM